MKTLVVDDDFGCSKLLKQVLSEYGSCDIASNGILAIELFEKAWQNGDPYNLLCLDISMPGLNGHQVLRHIRLWEADNEVANQAKVLMITGFGDPQTIMLSFKERCEDYLIKPFSITKLIEKICALGLIE